VAAQARTAARPPGREHITSELSGPLDTSEFRAPSDAFNGQAGEAGWISWPIRNSVTVLLLAAIDTKPDAIVDDYLETVRLADLRAATSNRNNAEPEIEALCQT